MKQNIEELVAGVLRELEVHGLTQSTIRQYKRGFYQPIIKFFNSSNSGVAPSTAVDLLRLVQQPQGKDSTLRS